MNIPWSKKEFFCVFSILMFGFVTRIYYLQYIPSELFGDVIEHMQFVQLLPHTGANFQFFFGGDGPLYPHFAYLLTLIFDLKYTTLKLATSMIGVITSGFVYLTCRELARSKLQATFAMILSIASFWSMSLSVAAKPYVLSGLFVVAATYLACRRQMFWSGLVIGLGMMTQASFWGMFTYPILLLAYHIILGAKARFSSMGRAEVLSSLVQVLAMILGASYFIYTLYRHPEMLGEKSYLGEKIAKDGQMIEVMMSLITGFAHNLVKNFAGVVYGGDGGFRHNVPGMAFLDPVTIFFVFYGLLVTVWPKHQSTQNSKLEWSLIFKYLALPWFCAQLASLADVNNPANSPNIGRLFGTSTTFFIVASYGVVNTFNILKLRSIWIARIVTIVLLSIVAVANLYKFAYIYPRTLPNANNPYGLTIARHIDAHKGSKPLFLDCCWGQWGQPEPYGVMFATDRFTFLPTISTSEFTSGAICTDGYTELNTGARQNLRPGSYTLYSRPGQQVDFAINSCVRLDSKSKIVEKGDKIADVYNFTVHPQ